MCSRGQILFRAQWQVYLRLAFVNSEGLISKLEFFLIARGIERLADSNALDFTRGNLRGNQVRKGSRVGVDMKALRNCQSDSALGAASRGDRNRGRLDLYDIRR